MVNVISLLKTLCTKIKKINDEKFDVASLQNICNGRSLTVSNMVQDFSVSAILVGNQIRVYFSTPSDLIDLGAGNITNEMLTQIRITHAGYLATLYGGRINSSTTGGIVSFYITGLDEFSSGINFDLYASATHQATTATNTYFAIPVELNTYKF